jgi:hypothetical protein
MEKAGDGLTARDGFWLEHVRACGAGSLKAYAEANGLEPRTLYGAKARLRRKGVLDTTPAPRLVRVERERSTGTGPAYCRVQFPNGVSVELACAPEQWPTLFASVATQP